MNLLYMHLLFISSKVYWLLMFDVSVWMLLNCCNKPTYVRCYYQMRQMVQRLVNLIVTSSHLGMMSWEFKYGLVYGYGVNQFGGKDGKEEDNARAF